MHTQTFIRLEDGRELTRARAGKTIEIHNVEQLRKVYDDQGYPVLDDQKRATFETVLGTVKFQEKDLFKPDMQSKLNIINGVRLGFEEKYFNKTGETEEVIGGVINIIPAISPRMSLPDLVKKFKASVLDDAKQRYNQGKVRYDQATDAFNPGYDAADPYILAFEAYRDTLRSAFNLFKSEVVAIIQGAGTNDEKYQALIDWYRDYSSRWPDAPTIAEIVEPEPA